MLRLEVRASVNNAAALEFYLDILAVLNQRRTKD
jgi:hypothetical protein